MLHFFLPVLCLIAVFLPSELLASSAEVHSSLSKQKKKYTLCICAIFDNDEAPYLKEWIEYHLLVGVEHFFLYNNGGGNDSLKILKPYLEQNIVELRNAPTTRKDKNWMDPQRRAYKQCIKSCQRTTEWLALIDIDEFIVPVDTPDLLTYLAQFDDQPSIGAILVNWQVYGTSWLPELPKDKLLIESLTLKAPWNYVELPAAHNGVIKSIVRPCAVERYRVHGGKYKSGFTCFPEEKEDHSSYTKIEIDHIRINHYWTRSENFFYAVKMKRWAKAPLSEESILRKLSMLNEVEDPIMMRFVPELRKRIFPEEMEE